MRTLSEVFSSSQGTQSEADPGRAGRHAVILGVAAVPVPSGSEALVLRVPCDAARETFGPLWTLTERAARLMGESPPLVSKARQQVFELGRRLLGDAKPERPSLAGHVETYNRLAAMRQLVLVFDVVDDADDATLHALEELVARRGWLHASLVLGFRARDVPSRAARLVELVRERGGIVVPYEREAAEVAGSTPPVHGAPAGALREGASSSQSPHSTPPPASETEPAQDLTSARSVARLGESTERVLRVAAVLGPAFDVEHVARLVGRDVLEVLFELQRAKDAGLPVVDRGDGELGLDAGLAAALEGSLLPSLRTELHRRAAALTAAVHADEPAGASRSGEALTLDPAAVEPPPPVELASVPASAELSPSSVPTEPPTEPEPTEPAPERDPRGPAEPASAPVASEPTPPPPVSAAARAPAADAPPPADGRERAAAFDPGPVPTDPAPRDPAAEARNAGPGATAPERSFGPRVVRRAASPVRRTSPTRAAEHLVASGEPALGAEQMLLGARRAAEQGAHRQAEALARRALGLLESLPPAPVVRSLKVRALLEIGRIRLEGFAPSEAFQLDGAEEVLALAKGAATSVAERCEAARLLAAVFYEKGDLPSLERALDELTQASRALSEQGDAIGAASLLNDQAAVYLRMGDPVRAMALAERSRAAFEGRADSPHARRELAETDLLIAKIPLHVKGRPGREADAFAAGIDHALAASRAFEALGLPLGQAAANETLGRLELARGRLDRAVEHLRAALSAQQALSDLLGLARTTGALSEALARAGQPRDALLLLAESVELNRVKGSALGVAHNRRAFTKLAPLADSAGLSAVARELDQKLRAAEEVLGAIHLPGER
jgi:tetratricopeptide (TPR) repeat protein